MSRALLVLCCLLAVPVLADDATPAPFTPLEEARIENVQLQRVIVERAVSDWRAKVAALKADIEKARPGWIWNPETGELTKTPEPKTETKK